MGDWFTSLDDAWRHFLAREEPLESFHAGLPDDPEAVGEGWLFVPPEQVREAALRVQGRLTRLDWLALTPPHFLHVWLSGAHGVDVERLRWEPPFAASYRRLNCFHEAVIVEVEAPALAGADAPPTFLPHLTLGYVREPADPVPLREILAGLREERLGHGEVTELLRVRFPAGKTTILQPWTVVERVRLRR